MFPHALVRNLVIPSVLICYLLYLRSDKYYEYIYILLYLFTVLLLPFYIVAAFLGYNPITWLLYPTWTDVYSPIQYLVFILIALLISFRRTLNHAYSYTLSVVSAGLAGYLYEIPHWLQSGVYALFRTAHNSFIVLDWGMLCIPIFILFVKRYKLRVSRFTVMAAIFFMLYCYCYYFYMIELRSFFVSLPLPFSKMIYFRTPSMLLILSLLNNLRNELGDRVEQQGISIYTSINNYTLKDE